MKLHKFQKTPTSLFVFPSSTTWPSTSPHHRPPKTSARPSTAPLWPTYSKAETDALLPARAGSLATLAGFPRIRTPTTSTAALATINLRSKTCCQLCIAPPRCFACGHMFLATSLLSVYCPLLHRPSVSAVQSAWTLTSWRSSRSQERIAIMIRMMVCVVTVTVVVSIVIDTSRMQELAAGCPQ